MSKARDAERLDWVSYLRVSTHEQAERELSLPAQRHAVDEYASRHGATISREYPEAGSGTNSHRPVFRQMLEDVLRPNSKVGTIVVHHTSRFTRNATEARVVKAKFNRFGIRVVSVCQEITDDPMGKLIDGVFECVDQYESEINGIRTSAAMAESVRQGYFPGARCPFGYRTRPVELRPGVVRHPLVPDDGEAAVVRTIYHLYVGLGGAKAVARQLNGQGLAYRAGRAWSKDLVLQVLDQSAVMGTYLWGKQKGARMRVEEQRIALPVEPIVDTEMYRLAQQVRSLRRVGNGRGRASASPHWLTPFIRCGRCGDGFQLETSGKLVDGELYRYCYYNCRKFCRSGKETCPGHRIATKRLDDAVLNWMADAICRIERAPALSSASALANVATMDPADLRRIWRSLITTNAMGARSYLHHLVDRIVVCETYVEIVPTPATSIGSTHSAHGTTEGAKL